MVKHISSTLTLESAWPYFVTQSSRRDARTTLLFKYCSDAIKDYMFKPYCTSMYGTHLWCNYNVIVLTKAKIAYNCIFMILGNLGRDRSIFANMLSSQICTCYKLLRKLSTDCIGRQEASENTCYRMVYDCLLFSESPISQHWLNWLMLCRFGGLCTIIALVQG